MLRAAWLRALSRRFLRSRNVKLGDGKTRRRETKRPCLNIEQLESRIVLSVDSFSYLHPPTPAVPNSPLVLSVHPDSLYRAPHGGSLAQYSVTENDFLPPGSTVSGGVPMTAPSIPGSYSYSYQVTDASGAVAIGTASVVATNSGPATVSRYAVIRPNGASPSPPPNPNNLPPQPLGGQANSSMSMYFGTTNPDPEGDALSAAASSTTGSVSLLPYVVYNGSPRQWNFIYTPPYGVNGLVEVFDVTVTDSFGASGATKMHIAVTNHPVFHWLMIEANNDKAAWGSQWDAPVTGNVLSNDLNPDGLSMTAALVGTAPAGLSFSADGSFSFMPPDIVAFMTGTAVTVPYTATDANGTTATATLTISPKILSPGEGASGLGFSVGNGTVGYGGALLAYPGSGGLVLEPQWPADYVVSASGPGGTVQWNGGVPSLKLTTNMNVGLISGVGALRIVGNGSGNVQSVSGCGDVQIVLTNGGNVGPINGVGRIVSISTSGSVAPISAVGEIVQINAGSINSVSVTGHTAASPPTAASWETLLPTETSTTSRLAAERSKAMFRRRWGRSTKSRRTATFKGTCRLSGTSAASDPGPVRSMEKSLRHSETSTRLWLRLAPCCRKSLPQWGRSIKWPPGSMLSKK